MPWLETNPVLERQRFVKDVESGHWTMSELCVRYGISRAWPTRAIRSDNGAPFASTGIHGLNRLNVWWLQLGITHQRITPGSPQQNGAHERMHKTLKARGHEAAGGQPQSPAAGFQFLSADL